MSLSRILALSVFGWFMFLAVLHFANPRPLWNDEYAVFQSIQNYSQQEIFSKPLLSYQVFPRAYLWLIQCFASFFDNSLWALRLLSFLSMLGALWAWTAVARTKLSSERLLALFLLSWCGSTVLVYYASELKQYSFDVLAAALFLLFLDRQQGLAAGSMRRYCLILFLLPFLLVLSYPAVFFLVFPFWQILRMGRQMRFPLTAYFVGCLGAIAFVFWFDLRLSAAAAQAIGGSMYKEYFISLDSPGAFLKSLQEGMNNLIGRWFASKPSWVRGVCRFWMIFGIVEMVLGTRDFIRRRCSGPLSVHVIALVLILEFIIMGALQRYYFTMPRTSLFFCPLLFLLTVLCLQRIEAALGRKGRWIQGAYALTLFFFAVIVTRMALNMSIAQDMTQWIWF